MAIGSPIGIPPTKQPNTSGPDKPIGQPGVRGSAASKVSTGTIRGSMSNIRNGAPTGRRP